MIRSGDILRRGSAVTIGHGFQTGRIYETLSKLTSEGIAICELKRDATNIPIDYLIHDTNPAWRRLLNIHQPLVNNTRASDVFASTPPPYLDTFAQAVTSGHAIDFESPFTEGERCFDISVQPLDSSLFAVIFTEITKWKLVEQRLHTSLKHANESLHGTVTALSTTSAWRDPYTASHQLHVAKIASAIGEKYGLPQEDIDGLYVAGLLHDIGKIAVPIEILCKPGKITDHEFGIIRNHPQVGYAILREIQFPWPIAEIVLQHHARLDGSGYPPLSGDEILIQARILAVADVVEAISSHRPYRPSLGIQVALEEIEKHAGTFYDEQVVEACKLVYHDNGTSMP